MKRVGRKTTYVRKLANNAGASNLDGRRLVGRSGGVTTVTRTANRATTDSVVATWNTDNLEGRELAPPMADDLRFCWSGGRIHIEVHGLNPSGSPGNVTGRRKLSWRFV